MATAVLPVPSGMPADDDGEASYCSGLDTSDDNEEDAAAVETASHAAASSDALTPASNDVSVITISAAGDEENPTIEKSPRGGRQREPAPEAFLLEDYEIYWESGGTSNGGWRLYLEDREKVSFYSASFETRRCEVEWNNDGFIRHTSFRVAGRRKRKRVDKSFKDEAPAKSPSKPRQKKQKRQTKQKQKKLPQRGKAKPPPKASESASEVSPAPEPEPEQEQEPEYDPTRGLGPHPHAEHPITTALRCTRDEVMATLPTQMREQFVDCCWVSWEGSHRPALLLSPFEVSGKQGIVDEWLSTYLSYKKSGNLAQMPHLVYWYEEGWSSSKDYKAFSLVKRGQIYPFGKGSAIGWDKPSFVNKIENPFAHGELTQQEDDLLRGIEQMKEDHMHPKQFRGGPMFFPHLREEQKEASNATVKSLEEKYAAWTTSSTKYNDCVQNATSRRAAVPAGELTSLELCAGEEVMSRAMKEMGFDATTLDNDLKRSATSKLCLEALESRITSGQINDHPYLNKPFNVIWAAPECTTWSVAANGRYRNRTFIDGFHNRALHARAQQARRDIESLVNILSYYRTKNSNVVIVIENPEGLLQHHPVSHLFETILGLRKLKISYCKFSTEDCKQPQKDTNLWTNSDLLQHQFDDGKFECKSSVFCAGKVPNGDKHITKAQDRTDRFSEYPSEMCKLIAPLLLHVARPECKAPAIENNVRAREASTFLW
ncbi:hypothetical protein ACHAXT_007343 [Thalassiosira profunda]